MAPLLKEQLQASKYRGLPTDDVDSSSRAQTVSGESVQFYYYNAGVQTVDAGQAAGTLVVGALAYENIKNQLGKFMATYDDTSLAITSTAFTNERFFPFDVAEAYDSTDAATRAQQITAGFANGDYCVDYVNGILYGVKASNQTTLTADYIISEGVSGGFVPTADVNVDQWGGVATTLGQKAMVASVPVVIASNQTDWTIPTTVLNGTNTTTIIVPEAIAASTACKYVVVQALTTNTGSVFVGNATGQNIELGAGDAWSFAIDDLAKVYYRVTVDNEGIAYSGAN